MLLLTITKINMKITIKQLSKLTLAAFLGSVLLFTSCSKDKDETPLPTPKPVKPYETEGVYVLCEGAYGIENNSEISFYNIKTNVLEKTYYNKINGKSLGNNANDLKLYGSKLYCTVTGTDGKKDSYVDVIDAATGKSLKRIEFFNGTSSFMPRYLAFSKGKVYVSNYDGKVSRIDTASLSIDATLILDKGLEQVAITNNKLYVANSSHFLYVGKEKVVTVIDLNTFTKIRDIEVPINPNLLTVTQSDDLLVASWGSYDGSYNFNNDGALTRINTVTDTKTKIYSYNNGEAIKGLNTVNGNTYIFSDSYFKHFSISDATLGTDFVTDGTTVNPYGLQINPLDNNVYVADANNYSNEEGIAFCLDRNGKTKFKFATSPFPKAIAFKYIYK